MNHRRNICAALAAYVCGLKPSALDAESPAERRARDLAIYLHWTAFGLHGGVTADEMLCDRERVQRACLNVSRARRKAAFDDDVQSCLAALANLPPAGSLAALLEPSDAA